MRHVIRTVNELPSNYNGRLTLVLNDRDPYVIARNLLLILLLALPDKSRGPDMALHFWYSAFVPNEYHEQMMLILLEFITKSQQPNELYKLSSMSNITSHASAEFLRLMIALTQSTYQIGDAANELHRVR